MAQKYNIVAVVPARGGSKSIPMKNIRPMSGIPLLAYSIAAGLQSEYVDRVIVSTDHEDIAAAALEWGAEVPFLRPAALAEDHTADLPVMEHVLEYLELSEGYRADLIVQLRPTSPLRPPGLVDEAIEAILQRPDADSVRCVTPSGQNPYKMWRFEQGKMVPLIDAEWHEPYNMPRQLLPETFWQTGHVEVIRRETITELKSLTGNTILPCPVPPEYAIDLDNLYQWNFAEYVLSHWNMDIVIPDIPAFSHSPFQLNV